MHKLQLYVFRKESFPERFEAHIAYQKADRTAPHICTAEYICVQLCTCGVLLPHWLQAAVCMLSTLEYPLQYVPYHPANPQATLEQLGMHNLPPKGH